MFQGILWSITNDSTFFVSGFWAMLVRYFIYDETPKQIRSTLDLLYNLAVKNGVKKIKATAYNDAHI